MKYYSTKRRNEIIIHATTWIGLAKVTLSEINHTQKARRMIPLMWDTKMSKSIETEVE